MLQFGIRISNKKPMDALNQIQDFIKHSQSIIIIAPMSINLRYPVQEIHQLRKKNIMQ